MSARNRTTSSRLGFTLIELLVAMAIIVSLAALLVPTFSVARERARQASCLSNEKQLSIAVLQYVQDNDETFPAGDCSGLGGYLAEGRGWAAIIYPYVKNTNIFQCADDPTPSNGSAVPVSYGFNADLSGEFVAPRSQSNLTASASTVMFFEVQNATENVASPMGDSQNNILVVAHSSVGGDGGDTYAGFVDAVDGAVYATGEMGQPTRNPGVSYFTNGVLGRHTQGSNFALADGHVKYILPQFVSPGFINSSPNNDQDQGTSYFGNSTGLAAGTGMMGVSPKNFIATFSPV